MIKDRRINHPASQGKVTRKEKKQWPPSKYPKASGKRQKKDWRCGERPPNRKKGALLEEKQVSKELDLESKEPATSCEEVSLSPPSHEWYPSSHDMGPTYKRPVASHLSIAECGSQIYSGVGPQENGGPMLKKGNWREKLRVKNENN